jgi:hypothetical protein
MDVPKYEQAIGMASYTISSQITATATPEEILFDAYVRISLIHCMPVVMFGFRIFGEMIRGLLFIAIWSCIQ